MKCVVMLLFLTVLLVGCQTKYAYIPVIGCPTPTEIKMPILQVNDLIKNPETKDALKALTQDHITLKSKLEQCILIVDSYKGLDFNLSLMEKFDVKSSK